MRKASPDSQDFAFLRSPDLVLMHSPYPLFLKKWRAILSAIELSAKDYACHSFRRAGASFAVQSGVPVELVKLLGAWGPFLESDGNFSGPKSNIQIEI